MVSQLERSGYGMEFRGFNEARIDLYAHKSTNLFERGSVGLRPLVSNPKNLNAGETAFLERKAAMGLFPWKPGTECLSRTFRDVKVIRDAYSNTSRVETTASYKGCKWCREIELRGEVEEQEGVSGVEPSLQLPNDPTPPVTVIACSVCSYVPPEANRAGKSQTVKQRENALRLHNKQHTRTA